MDQFSFLNAVHGEFLEDLYLQYLKNPDSLEPSWKAFFQGYDFANKDYALDSDTVSIPQNKKEPTLPSKIQKEFDVINLINGYRQRGHLFTRTNPVRNRRSYTPTLELANFGLSDSDLNESFNAGSIIGFLNPTTLREIIERLERMYCESIGIEYMYIRHPKRVKWIQDWLNQNQNHPILSLDDRKEALKNLNKAVVFENFLHTKFVGQKRFSLEGGESLVPGMVELVDYAAEKGVEEFVIGMSHRGRLNILANIFDKPFKEIFSEFTGKEFEDEEYDGDVKYHLGATKDTTSSKGKKIKMNLAPNPSHLETVSAVVEGITRAKIDREYGKDNSKVLPILVHGDAAIAGQGIVYEIVQMMTLDGYTTGGTIHIVVNNQIGFTTNYTDGRSSTYCTDIGKVTLSPILHVNSDDVEAVLHAMRFAVDYRTHFSRDVFIDLLGYRKYGHNEGDEPRFTQPILYKAIAKHSNPSKIYAEKLIQKGYLQNDSILEAFTSEYKTILEKAFVESKAIIKNKLDPFLPEKWEGFIFPTLKDLFTPVDTKYPVKKLKKLGNHIANIPNDKKLLKKTERMLTARREMMVSGTKIDWGMAETLAYASLLEEGFDIRISGEDVERGTFSHRHAVMLVQDSEEKIIPLANLPDQQGDFQIYNSHLSEYGVLGFDYGYAMATPNTLTVWEAQFGDFSNGAQIIIDQYLSGAEDKWKVRNGLVMLLPHGYEGQGAEHSSARMERYLQVSAQFNMFVANCTTPANIYHILRRQMKSNYRKPLIVFTPKSLLRHPLCVSDIKELSEGGFKMIIDDEGIDKEKIERVIVCTGKLYYDLLNRRTETPNEKVALVRLEQLYPLPMSELKRTLKKYPNHKELIWAQEEPKNMGAWSHILRRLREFNFDLISPSSSAATAAGSSARFKKTQESIINQVFDI